MLHPGRRHAAGRPGSSATRPDPRRFETAIKTAELIAAETARAPNQSALDSARAWLMAATAFLSCFVVFGVMYSFGAFFASIRLEFGANRASTALIFSLTAAIYSVLGLIAGRLGDRFGPRRVIFVGAVALGAGLIATASAHSLTAVYLTYGIGVGIGIACGYVPMLAVVGGWFERRRNAAMGVAVAGIGVGTLACAPLAAALIRYFGWRAAYRLIGFGGAAALVLCAMVVEAPPRRSGATSFRIARLTRSRNFVCLYGSSLLVSITIYVPFVYLPGFAESRGITPVAAAALVGLIGAASLIGRLGFGPIADRVGILELYRLSLLVIALSYIIWPFTNSYATLVLFTVVMGSAYGGMVSLSPSLVAQLFGVEGLGTLLGALYSSFAISALAGPPLVGFAIDRGGYLWAAVIAGTTGFAGFCALLPLRES